MYRRFQWVVKSAVPIVNEWVGTVSRMQLINWDVSTQTLPDAFERYVVGMSDIYDVVGVSEHDRANFFNVATGVMSPFGALGDGVSVRQTLSRDQNVLRRSGFDGLHLLINATATVGDADGTTVRAEPNALQIRDMGRPTISRVDTLDVMTLMIPRNLAPPALLERSMHGVALSPSIGGVRLVRAHMRALVDEIPNLSEEALDSSIQALLLIAGRLVGIERPLQSPELETIQRTVRRSAINYIEHHLQTGSMVIDIDAMAASVGVSRATLYRAFDLDGRGGVSRYIQDRRLHYAREALRNRDKSQSVAEIAAAHGFSSSSHFSRLFRETYGYSPSDVGVRSNDFKPVMSEGPVRHDLLSAWLAELGSDPKS